MMLSRLLCVLVLVLMSVIGIKSNADISGETGKQVVVRYVDDLRRPAFRALSKAQQLVDSNKDQNAISHLDKFLERKKGLNVNELAQIHHMRAFAYYKQGEYSSAIYAYLKVIDNPNGIHIDLERQTYKAIAQMYVGLRNYKLAKEWYIAWLNIGAQAGWEEYKEIAVAAAFDEDIEVTVEYSNQAIAQGIAASGYLTTELLSAQRYASDRLNDDSGTEKGFQTYHNKNHIKVIGIDSSFIDSLGFDSEYVGSINLRYQLSSSGKVRNPVVVNKTDDELATVVLEKLQTHDFAPVLVRGLPSNVVLNEELTFGNDTPPES